jgi:iron complex outermembrane recepter protein
MFPREMRLALGIALGCASAFASAAGPEETVVVTGTKVAEPLASSSAMITVVSGADARARGAHDLRQILALAGGVDVAPGSDAGPAGSVPAMWGLREIDAFLLLVDGVPYGGAFNPALATLDLTNVARIEILRGAAPVMHGATSFVGVINVIHESAGEATGNASAALGSRGTVLGSAATNLPAVGAWHHSVVADAEMRRFSQDDSDVRRAHTLYRGAAELGIGTLRVDADLTALRQAPYSPHPREGQALTQRLPLDANANPSDAREDQDRGQFTASLDRPVGAGRWVTTLSAAHTTYHNTRGFLREDFAANGVDANADGFRQRIGASDGYFDTYLELPLADSLEAVLGADWLHGKASQHSDNFEYAVRPDGSNRPDSHSLPVDESTHSEDERNFGGTYAYLRWRAGRMRLNAGLRANRTREHREGGEITADAQEAEDDSNARRTQRLSGSLGASWTVWRAEDSFLTLFADYRNAFKPAAVDFGPEAEADILAPEYGRSREVGVRGQALHDRLQWQSELFDMQFENLVIRENVDGLPALANAGRERFRGFEFEGRASLARDLWLAASYACHDARFVDYARTRADGALQQLAGKRLELSPQALGAVSLVYGPPAGFQASVTWSYLGPRFLDKANSARAGGYSTIDAGVGYRIRSLEIRLDGSNLTGRRDPVAESELGDAQFYRLPGLFVQLGVRTELRWRASP